jgi:membrane protease YdiL (CAAX protease family)
MEKEKEVPLKSIGIFLLLALALSSVVWLLTLNAGNGGRLSGRIYGYGIMWCPALATYLTCRILKLNFSLLPWRWGSTSDLTWSALIPIAYSAVAYILIWIIGGGNFYNQEFVTDAAKQLGWSTLPDGVFIVLFVVVTGVIGMIGSMSTALGEEIGWRGFLVPRLMAYTSSYTKTSLISGLIWAVWHYPLLIFGDYNNGAPALYGITCFTVLVVSISFVYTWFIIKTKSLWTGVLLHASHNLFVQGILGPLTLENEQSRYLVGEFGAVLPAVTVVVAIYFWTKRAELRL